MRDAAANPRAPRRGSSLEDARGIAAEIADHLVELSDRDAHT
jgi:hypothetical protein